MKLSSSAFAEGQAMPRQYTGEGDDISPPLRWVDPPHGCQEFALTVLDPDAPGGKTKPFVHWVAYGISGHTVSLGSRIPKRGDVHAPEPIRQGVNSFGRVGYGGPLPPLGDPPHHYIFKLYALDKKLQIPPETTKEALLKAIDHHVLATAELTAVYQR